MKQIFSFTFTSYSFFPILAGIFYVIRSYCFFFFNKDNYKPSLIFQIVLLEFGMFLSFILELINIYRQISEKFGFKSEIKKWIEKYKELKIIGAMFCCGFFDFIGVFLTYLILREGKDNQHLSSLMRITEFFFVSFMYYYFLKKKLKFHQYVSLCFIVLGLIFVFLKGIYTISSTIIFCIIGNLSYASLEIVYNWLMESKYVSSYELVAISGFFGCVVGTIFSLIFSVVHCDTLFFKCENVYKYVTNYKEEIGEIFSSSNHLIEVGAYVFFSLCYNTFHFLTNKHLSPTHRIISDSVSSLMTFTVTVITKGNEATTWFILLQIVGHILIIFGILVYNELMIVHVCGMDENTNKEIQGRAKKETQEGEGDVSLLPVEERSNSISPLPEKDNPAYNNSLC